MKAVFIIDFEMFEAEMIEKIKLFRWHLPPSIPVYWTITEHESTKPSIKDGFIPGRDRLFIKPDIDASLETAADEEGHFLMDVLRTSKIAGGYLAGATFYGCIMGGALSLREIGIEPSIMEDLTDFANNTSDDHAEAAAQWQAYQFPVTDSYRALQELQRQAGPRPPQF